jgi:hypothetical protein
MLDPVGGFGRIKDFFISYVETAFRISDRRTAAARRALLESEGMLATVPFVEPVLRYRTAKEPIEKLIDDPALGRLSRAGKVAFAELALSGLFDGETADGEIKRKSVFPPYIHQKDMLLRGVQPGKPGIVTSGTGSGKTESFMLPLLAQLSDEAVRWAAPGPGYLQSRWWTGTDRFRAQRGGESRPAAIKALVLYPMNALVDDQMVRLRRTLDSDGARAVMDDRFNGNRIFFGQYTSATPVTGYERHPRRFADKVEQKRRRRRLAKLRAEMRAFEKNQNAARAHDLKKAAEAAADGGSPEDPTRYIFPSIDGGEMVSRWDMHAAPPDILVTNASMLGTMLSREVEERMFDQTRDWLLNDENAYFYLVIDELHLVRGSAGTEVSFLIKSLLQRLGLDDPAHMYKLRILASSASLPLDEERGTQSLRYLRDLFAPFGTCLDASDPGTRETEFWRSCVVPGEANVLRWDERRLSPEPFERLLAACDPDGHGFVATIEPSKDVLSAFDEVLTDLGIAHGVADSVIQAAVTAAAVLSASCASGDGVRATSVADIAGHVFGDKTRIDAVRGLMLVRALPESKCDEFAARLPEGVPSFRFHGFIRNVEGLFGSIRSVPGGIEIDDLTTERGVSHGEPAGDEPRGRRLFELLYCEACGELLIGGQRGDKDSRAVVEMLPSAADLENIPEKGVSEYYDKMLFDQFAVFWPRRDEWKGSEKKFDSWEQASLDPNTGVATIGADVPPGHRRSSLLPDGRRGDGQEEGGVPEDRPALLLSQMLDRLFVPAQGKQVQVSDQGVPDRRRKGVADGRHRDVRTAARHRSRRQEHRLQRQSPRRREPVARDRAASSSRSAPRDSRLRCQGRLERGRSHVPDRRSEERDDPGYGEDQSGRNGRDDRRLEEELRRRRDKRAKPQGPAGPPAAILGQQHKRLAHRVGARPPWHPSLRRVREEAVQPAAVVAGVQRDRQRGDVLERADARLARRPFARDHEEPVRADRRRHLREQFLRDRGDGPSVSVALGGGRRCG